MVLSLRSDNVTYNPSFSTIDCGKAECSAVVTHVLSYSPESQVLVPQSLVRFFFYRRLRWMRWLSFLSVQGEGLLLYGVLCFLGNLGY